MTDNVSHADLSQGLWAFISDFLSTSMYDGRDLMAPIGNGFELWRRYYVEFKGRDKEIRTDGKLEFMQMSRHGKLQGLSDHLDRWEHLRAKYCINLPDDETFTLLLNIIPEDLKFQAMVDKSVTSMPSLMEWVRLRTDAFQQHQNSELLIKERAKSRATNVSPVLNETVNALRASEQRRGRSPGTQKEPKGKGKGKGSKPQNALTDKPRPRSTSRDRPDPKFPGCWYCKSTDHTRQNCPKYKKAREDNGGKHPSGAWENEKAKPTVNAAVMGSDAPSDQDTEDESDGDELQQVQAAPCMVWPTLSTAPKRKKLFCKPRVGAHCPCSNHNESVCHVHTNTFNNLADECDDDDMKMIMALENGQIEADVEGWAKVKNPRKKKLRPEADLQWLAEIGKCSDFVDLRAGLEEDEELVLMDSGCGNHIANPKKHFRKFKTRQSAGQRNGQEFVLADKSKIKNLGEKEVHFSTEEGHECSTIFQQANVAMPIFSIRKLGRTHRTVFADRNRDHGYIEHRTTGQRTAFFSRHGVYFMKIRLREPTKKTEETVGRPA